MKKTEVFNMPAISPKLGELLIKTTGSSDIDNAFEKVFSEYIELKLKDLKKTSESFQNKWGMCFEDFKEKIRTGALTKDSYAFDVEKDFWLWEEAETLKKHYETQQEEWL